MLRRFTDWMNKRNRDFIMDDANYTGEEHARLTEIFNDDEIVYGEDRADIGGVTVECFSGNDV